MKIVVIDLSDCQPGHRSIRLVPRLGSIVEQKFQQSGCFKNVVSFKHGKGDLLMAAKMTNTQKMTVTLEAKNSLGGPAKLDGVPAWAVDNDNILGVNPSEDGLSAEVFAEGMIGTATVQVTADADLTEGQRNIIGLLEIEITGGEATIIQLTPGEPTEQEPKVG